MLNSKKIIIGGKDILVTEVKVKRLLKLMPFLSAGQEKDTDDEPGFMDNIDQLLHDCCGLQRSDVEDMHGSELEALWAAFHEVNGFFFKTVENLGLEKTIGELLNTTLSAYGGMFASLLSGVTGDAPITELVGLLQQEKTRNESAEQQ